MTKKTTKNITKKETIVKEEIVDNTPKKYYVDFYFRREPVDKDKIIGTILYSDTTEKIDIEWLEPSWSSEIEQLMTGDIMFMDGLGSPPTHNFQYLNFKPFGNPNDTFY